MLNRLRNAIQDLWQDHGAAGLLPHMGVRVRWRLRDRLIARRLRAPGFRAARAPRLLGTGSIELGPDFHARDFLWLEAVTRYNGQKHAVGEEKIVLPRLSIGAAARLSDDVHIACLREVTIGDHLLCGSHVLISDHAHGDYRDAGGSDPAVPPAQRPLVSTAPVKIGNNVWLGDGVAVLAGAEIGNGCVVGAHAVVTGKIPPNTVAVGAPARPIRRWSEAEQGWVRFSATDDAPEELA